MTQTRTRRQRNPDKLDIRMSFKVRYGHEDDDQVVFMDERPMKLVGSAFAYRDKAMAYVSKALVKVALMQSRVAGKAAKAGARGTAKTAGKSARASARMSVKAGVSAARQSARKRKK